MTASLDILQGLFNKNINWKRSMKYVEYQSTVWLKPFKISVVFRPLGNYDSQAIRPSNQQPTKKPTTDGYEGL